MKKDTFYITTPIYYPSGNWHIGTCYTTVICDAIARFNRLTGKDVFFLTGTDEHGQKIETKAQNAGVTPKEFIDPIVDDLKNIWAMLDVSYDKFIRTTDDYHVKAVQKIFRKLHEQGDIYKSSYEGWYCTDCESFWTETQLVDGKCPDCGRAVHIEKEESYFFRLSAYADKILELYKNNPEFLQPSSRVNEMVNNFIKPGLQDLCVSRKSVKWGIPVDFDSEQTVYVWIDALPNYLTALGYMSDDDSLFKKFWPANVHMVGKEIVRFHAIIWPAILMALGVEIPKRIYGHGWLLIGGDKLSKSKQDKVKTELTDPKDFVERYGSDALRYYLLREIPFGSDGAYSNAAFLTRINSDLANDLGNLVSRTTAMIDKYFDGVLPEASYEFEYDKELKAIADGVFGEVKTALDNFNAPKALTEIFKLVGRANKYIDETMPWVLAKDEAKKGALATVMYNLSECIRIAAVNLLPFIPKAAREILSLYGIDCTKTDNLEKESVFGKLESGIAVTKSRPIFPRIDVQKECAEIEKLMTGRHEEKLKAEKTEQKIELKQEKETKAVESKVEKDLSAQTEQIGIDDFFKTDLRVADVVTCERLPKSKKLLLFTLDLNGEKRTVVSGIAQYYTPEELVGTKVVLVANLKPAKLCGVESQGMILCSEDEDGNVKLVRPDASAKANSRIR